MKKHLDKVLAELVEKDIPFANVFGNHDGEGPKARSVEAIEKRKRMQQKIYDSYPNCVSGRSPSGIHGISNYLLQVKDSRGRWLGLDEETGAASWESDEADLYFDDYADTILMMDDFAVSFDEYGMTVTFAEYDIAPHAGGMPSFLIPYAEFSRYLNERGERLLNLKPEDRALGDYYEAEEMWSWFDLTTMPLDPERPASEEGYYAVDYRDITTMAQLRTLLETRFSAEIVDELLTAESGFAHYKEIDGVLCAVQADRGSDITVASVDYAVELDGDHTAGRVIATIHRQDFDEAKEEWYLTGEPDTLEFPFEMAENGARFTFFESAY